MKYKLRIPAISQIWKFVEAKSEDEAFDKVVSELEEANPRIQWRDRDVWEIREVEGPLPDLRRAPRSKPVVCPGCGELKIEELVYCTKCGTDLPLE